MFGFDATQLAFGLLIGASIGGFAYALLFDYFQRADTTARRMDQVKQAESDRSLIKATRDKAREADKRRKSVQDTIKELDEKHKARDASKKPPLRQQLKQAGMTVSVQVYYILCVVFALFVTFGAFVAGAPVLLLPVILILVAFGVSRWVVSFRKKRRIKAFLNEFPNALDVIVRAVKSGLPLNDGVRLIANESPEPVRTEFKRIVEGQQIGLSMSDSALRLPETMPCPEAAFFGIVIQIQSQAGGNLSEAIGNLSRVLRDRKKMKAKVQALSMEAKASAWIIGALPFLVGGLIYLSNPSYIATLFVTTTGNIVLGVSAVWMSFGIMVMRNMMNFEV